MSPQPKDPSALPLTGARLEHRRIAGLVAILGPGALGALLLTLALALGRLDYLAPGALALAAGLILLLVRRRIARRVRTPETAADEPPGRFAALFLGALGVAALVAWNRYSAAFDAPFSTGQAPVTWLPGWAPAGIAIACALAFALLARFYGTTREEVLPEAAGLASWLRLAFWLTLFAALVDMHGEQLPWLAGKLATLGRILLIGLVAELALTSLLARRRGRLAVASPFLLRLIFGRFNPISSFFALLSDAFGIDLRGSWALAFIRRSLEPTALVLVLLGWIISAFTIVGPAERGVSEVFGARTRSEPIEPGLYLGWPWPIERVQRVAVDRVRSLPIGFAGARQGASLLWTAQHAKEEYKLLLGDGHDLVSVNAILQFRVRDPLAYLYRNADPEGALSSIADRVLMGETVGRSLDRVLSENLTHLAATIEARIQEDADELGLGFEIVDLTLMGLHPPVSVARDYQAVVGARIDRDTRVLEAQAYVEEVLPGAEAQAHNARRQAEAERTARVARARGEAAAFTAVEQSYAAAPSLFTFRRRLEAREAQLQGRSFVVIDQRFERDGGALWFSGSGAGAPVPMEDL